MKVVALHTDFRIYWPARLKALSDFLSSRKDSLDVIEIAGKGSPYSFAQNQENKDMNWHILFSDAKPEELSGKEIEPVLFDLLNKIKPDVIIAGAIAFPSGALAVRYGQLHKTKVIIFDDSKAESVKRNPLVNFIKQAVYNGVDAMFYPADDWILTGEFWKFNREQLFFGVDVVDNDFWSKPRSHANHFDDYFISVGRQIPVKNFDIIVDAYAKYVSIMGDKDSFKLILIGEGPERNKIIDSIKKNNLEKKIKLLPFQSQEDLAEIYQNARGLILNSSSETWGLVINEAMACGCPIFASNQCGATNILVKDGVNGFRFECNDIEAISESLVKYHNLSDSDKQKMREESRILISEWDLSRFTNGAINAIDYVHSSPKSKPNLIDRQIISRWKGQYRPV